MSYTVKYPSKKKKGKRKGLLSKTIKASGGSLSKKEAESLIASFNIYAKARKNISVERYLDYCIRRGASSSSRRKGNMWVIKNTRNGKNVLNYNVLDVLVKRAVIKWGKVENKDLVTRKKRKVSKELTKKRADYKEYLKTDWWKARRYSKIISIGMCEVCGSDEHLLVHHLNYSNLGCEKDSDLSVLCSMCHKRLHKEYGRGASFGENVIRSERKNRQNIL
jgi:hypothetical protein